jgi:hypothetical protein
LKILILLIIFKSIMYVRGPSISFFLHEVEIPNRGPKKDQGAPQNSFNSSECF